MITSEGQAFWKAESGMGPVADYRLRRSGREANGDIAVNIRHLTRSLLPGDAIWLIVSKPEITAWQQSFSSDQYKAEL